MLITWKGQNYDFCQVKTGQCHNMKPLSLPPLKPLTEFHLKRESLPRGVIIATKLLDVNDNCTQRPFQTHVHCTQGFGSVAQSCMSWGPIEIWRRSGSRVMKRSFPKFLKIIFFGYPLLSYFGEKLNFEKNRKPSLEPNKTL